MGEIGLLMADTGKNLEKLAKELATRKMQIKKVLFFLPI